MKVREAGSVTKSCRNDGMCDLIVRQGPEGRSAKRQPSPEGLGYR
jgi:hypothetical protein